MSKKKKKIEELTPEKPAEEQKPVEPKKVGRPTKYRPELCDLYISHCKDGGMLEDFPATAHEVYGIFIDISTIYSWAQKNGDHFIEEFSEAKKAGDAYSRRWWLRTTKKAAIHGIKGYPSGPVVFMMKNKFNWTDKHEITGADGGPIKVENGKKDRLRELLKDPEKAKLAAEIGAIIHGVDRED